MALQQRLGRSWGPAGEIGGSSHDEWNKSANALLTSMDKSNIAITKRIYADTKIYKRGTDY